jgi:hypothetical protein
VARELLRRRLKHTPCAGTHVLAALAVMLRVDASIPVLSSAVRAEVQDYLRTVVNTLIGCQCPEGYWFPFWYQDLPGVGPLADRVPMGKTGQILATGHHLEWLVLLPSHLQPPHQVFARGARWLSEALMEESRDGEWVVQNYCPATHAARSLLLLSGGSEVNPPGIRRQ